MKENNIGLYELPHGWVWTELHEIAESITGNTPSTKEPNNYGDYIPFIKPPELGDCVITNATHYLSKKGAQIARILPPNSVLMSCIGILGKTGINKSPVAFNQQINAAVFHEGIIPEYGFYYFQTLKSWLYSAASATTLPIVNKSKFSSAPFPLAPHSEQHSIVAKIEELFTKLDAGIEALEKIKAQLKRYRQVVLRHAFEGKLTEEWRKTHEDELEPASVLLERLDGERKKSLISKYKELTSVDTKSLPELPDGWIWARFSAVCDKIQDGSHFSPNTQFPIPAEDRYLYITAKNIKENGIDLSNVTYVDYSFHKSIYERCNPEYGDVLLVKDGVKTGIATINNMADQFSLLSSVALFKPNVKLLNSYYLKYFLNSPTGFKTITGQMTGTAIKRIILDKLRLSYLPLPSLAEQQKIIEEIESRLSIEHEAEKAIKKCLRWSQRLRQSILKRTFEGKLVSQDPAHEPAQKLLERIRQERAKHKAEEKTTKGKNSKQMRIV